MHSRMPVSRTSVARGVAILAVVSAVAVVFGLFLDAVRTDWPMASLYLFATQEPPAFTYIGLVALSVLLAVSLGQGVECRSHRPAASSRVVVVALAAVAGIIAITGRYV